MFPADDADERRLFHTENTKEMHTEGHRVDYRFE